MKKKTFISISIVLYILLFAVRLTGPKWHLALGLLLTCLMVKHTCIRLALMKRQNSSVRFVNYVLMAALLTILVTGILMHPLHGMLVIKLLHKLSAIVFGLAMFGHIRQHMGIKTTEHKKNREVNEE